MDNDTRRAIIRSCNRGPGGMRVLPQRDELERRLAETVGVAAAARICTLMGPTNADAQFFAADVGVLLPAQLEEATAPPVKRPRANAGMFSTRHRLLARREADEDRLRRQILLEKKRLSRESGVLRVDPTHSIERALEMVEVLPQGSMAVQGPLETFLELGVHFAGEGASPERQVGFGMLSTASTFSRHCKLEKSACSLTWVYATRVANASCFRLPGTLLSFIPAILLEEYALQLMAPYTNPDATEGAQLSGQYAVSQSGASRRGSDFPGDVRGFRSMAMKRVITIAQQHLRMQGETDGRWAFNRPGSFYMDREDADRE